jgi:UV DNA damage repair endonuclease
MTLTNATMASLTALARAARRAKLENLVRHNLGALERQIAWVAGRPPIARLLRMASNVLPGYTHPVARDIYAEPEVAALVERGLAEAGALARRLGVRLSFHPGPFCLLAVLTAELYVFFRLGQGEPTPPTGPSTTSFLGSSWSTQTSNRR